MENERFLEKLSEYVEKGILKVEIFEEIKENVYHQNKEDIVSSKNDGFSSESKPISFFNKDNAMRFSLGVAAGIGALLVLLGFALLTSLIQDLTGDYDNGGARGIELYWLVFSLLSISALLTSKIKLEGRAEVFLGEARSIIFGVSSMVAVTHFIEEVINFPYDESFGPLNILEWGPILGVVVYSMWFARLNNAWVSYSLGWILWFIPINYASLNYDTIGTFFNLVIILGVLVFEVLREWFDEQREDGSWIQLMGNGFLVGIVAWFLMDAFAEAFGIERMINEDGYEYSMDIGNPLMGCIFILSWIIWMQYFVKSFDHKKYKNTGRSKAWPLILGCLIFYTFIPNITGFLIGDWFGFEDVGIGEFDVSVGIIIGCLIHIIMGLQMFNWEPKNVVVKPSLTNPGTFMGSVFLIMAFFTFIGGMIDLLEELAGYLFLPIGLLVLIFGTKKLIEKGEVNTPNSVIVGELSEE